ncbi:MAG: hypothetical protein ACLTCQ_07905 [Enterocloster bolteae]
MEKIIPEEDPVGLDILTYQFIEILTKMMYPRDRVWIEDGKLLLFLNQIGSRKMPEISPTVSQKLLNG